MDVRMDTAGLRRQAEEYYRTQSRRRNLEAAQQVAERWLRAAPDEPRAHAAMASVLLQQGRVAQADAAMRRATEPTALFETMRRVFQRMEIAHKLYRAPEAIRLYDSVRAAPTLLPGTPFHIGNIVSGYGPPFGRLAEFDSLLMANFMAQNAPASMIAYQRRAIRAALGGVVHDSLAAQELDVFERVRAARGAAAATQQISATLLYSLRMPRTQWPQVDTMIGDPRFRPAIALALGDSARLRAAARALDSLLQVVARAGSAEADLGFIAVDAYLALRDTAAALRTLRFAIDSAGPAATYFPLQSQGFTPASFMPRLMLLRADLAAARGFPDEARLWYDRFLAIWATANAELQPVIQRARAARAALGG
jgi:hypothetical protein